MSDDEIRAIQARAREIRAREAAGEPAHNKSRAERTGKVTRSDSRYDKRIAAAAGASATSSCAMAEATTSLLGVLLVAGLMLAASVLMPVVRTAGGRTYTICARCQHWVARHDLACGCDCHERFRDAIREIANKEGTT